jgi:hypothetical protein
MKWDTKARRQICGFWSFLPWTLAMSHCAEEDWKGERKKKRYVSQHNKRTQAVFLLLRLASTFIAPGDLYSGFIKLCAKFLQSIWNANRSRAPWKDRNIDGLEWEFWKKSILYSKIGGQVFGSWGTLLGAKNNHSRDMRLLVQALEKRVKVVRPVATLVFLYSARLRLQCSYAYERVDDYIKGYC